MDLTRSGDGYKTILQDVPEEYTVREYCKDFGSAATVTSL